VNQSLSEHILIGNAFRTSGIKNVKQMAVLIEAISVVIRRQAIDAKYPGGWNAFVRDAPNSTLCGDDQIARIGFMSPSDVEVFVNGLEEKGLVFIQDDKTKDLAVVDQFGGFTRSCDWLEFGHIEMSGSNARVAACRCVGSTANQLITPDRWKYEGSISDKYCVVTSEYVDEGMTFLRHENGLDVYLNNLTNEEVYVGRTSK
jgi:hypothetical protein